MATILIADDDVHHIKIYTIHFKKAGFDVLVATDGHQAIEMMKVHKPQLVFMDMIMPVFSGLEVLDKMKSDDTIQTIPVVMLTILSDEAHAEMALMKGAVGYIAKLDTSPEAIVTKAKEILGTSEKPYDPRGK